jgi:hypothetical protein
MTPQELLQDAVGRNDPIAVIAALDAGAADGCEVLGHEWSWLAEALRLGHKDAALAFLSHRPRLGLESQSWAIHGLLQGPRDDLEMARALLDRESFILSLPSGLPFEHTVAESGHPQIAAELFSRGLLRPAILDSAGWTPLLKAVRAGDTEMAGLFLENGAPLNAVIAWSDQRSALHIALEASDPEGVVSWLLDHGIDTRSVDGGGKTAAERAIENGDGALARLIENRADAGGPRWHREAVQEGMNDVVCAYYDKTDGFCFDPHDVVRPFLIGGDYGGAFPETPRAALDFARQCDPKSSLGHAVRPWIKVIERMVEGEGVALEEILPLGSRRKRP